MKLIDTKLEENRKQNVHISYIDKDMAKPWRIYSIEW